MEIDVPSDNAVDVDVDEELADEQESDHQE